MQRLEELAGVPLLEAVGRRRVLTEAGERLVGHGRRILAANREAWLSISGATLGGPIGIGLTQDFAGDALLSILNQFARTHPRLRMDLRVGRTVELTQDLQAKRIDVLLAMRRSVEPDEIAVIREPMQWLVARDGLVAPPHEELPLAVLDSPCSFRDAALRALDAAGRPYRIAATSPSLAGIIAAVRAGVALTARTRRSLESGLIIAPKEIGLPRLPDAEFSIRLREDASELAHRLAEILAAGLRLRTDIEPGLAMRSER
jgi:DNA-binding transcriptional LysR family regulator